MNMSANGFFDDTNGVTISFDSTSEQVKQHSTLMSLMIQKHNC